MSVSTSLALYLPGESAPPSAKPLAELPFLILVGLTGVGKSSLLEALHHPTLPDRREVVDRYVLPLYGHSAQSQLDRAERFALTRRFRAEHPGGVAEVLLHGKIQPVWPVVFDGLRGEDEVRFALEHLPLARFVLLQARDITRLSRLLRRGDSFDRVRIDQIDLDSVRALAEGVLSEGELEEALSWNVSAEDLSAKLKIVAEERKNYDPAGAGRVLEGSSRALFLDTETLSVEQEAEAIQRFIRA
ncbi:MAG: hypothetical protein SFU83_11480 [Meiothermus sp.]|nr:hypothetical protein [Meiothermus sp.]